MRLDLFPLQTVLFPRMRLPLHIFEPRYRVLIGHCVAEDLPFGIALIKSGDEVGGPAIPYEIGTTARIIRADKLDDGRLNVLVEGRERFRIQATLQTEPHLIAEIGLAPMPTRDPRQVAAMAYEIRQASRRALALLLELQAGYNQGLDLPRDPERLAYFIAAAIPVEPAARQRLLESDSLDALLEQERGLVDRQIGLLERRVEERWAGRQN